MEDAPKTEAKIEAIRLLGLYGTPTTREGFEALLARAYTRGALAAAREAAEAVKRA